MELRDEVDMTDEQLRNHFSESPELQARWGHISFYLEYIHEQRRLACCMSAGQNTSVDVTSKSDDSAENAAKDTFDEGSLRAKFEASEELQIEFHGNVDHFLAYERHEHKLREKQLRVAERRRKPAGIDEDSLRAEFAQSEDLQAEFRGNAETYLAFKRAEARSDVTIAGRGRAKNLAGSGAATEM